MNTNQLLRISFKRAEDLEDKLRKYVPRTGGGKYKRKGTKRKRRKGTKRKRTNKK